MTETDGIAVVGAGPAGLMAADVLSALGWHVTIFERMPTPARKFLMAGRGGLNLTHSEGFGNDDSVNRDAALEKFLTRYGPAADWLADSLRQFPPHAVREFAQRLGQETFIGSSGRVFPTAMKASPFLRAWLRRLDARGVPVKTRHHWLGFAGTVAADQLQLRFEDLSDPSNPVDITHTADGVVLALGGASWPRLGSTGEWAAGLMEDGVAMAPFRPGNCGFVTSWSSYFANRFGGAPLKDIAISFGNHRVAGEALITTGGIEGGAIYALSPHLRDAIEADGAATIQIDLRPGLTLETLQTRLAKPQGRQSLSNHLRKTAGLSPLAINLLREATMSGAAPGQLPGDPEALAALIKACPLRLTGTMDIERAISSAGGICAGAVDQHLMLKTHPGVFVAGEMLDWEAPTGGYLLQGAFSTGSLAAHGLGAWLRTRQTPDQGHSGGCPDLV